MFDSLKNVVNPPVVAKQQQLQDAVNSELTAAAAGRASVDTALSNAASAVNKLVQ